MRRSGSKWVTVKRGRSREGKSWEKKNEAGSKHHGRRKIPRLAAISILLGAVSHQRIEVHLDEQKKGGEEFMSLCSGELYSACRGGVEVEWTKRCIL